MGVESWESLFPGWESSPVLEAIIVHHSLITYMIYIEAHWGHMLVVVLEERSWYYSLDLSSGKR